MPGTGSGADPGSTVVHVVVSFTADNSSAITSYTARAMNGAVQVGTASVTSAPVVNHGYGLGLFYLAVDLGTNPCPIRSSLSFKVSATNAKGTGSAGSGAAYQVNPFLHTTFDCTP